MSDLHIVAQEIFDLIREQTNALGTINYVTQNLSDGQRELVIDALAEITKDYFAH